MEKGRRSGGGDEKKKKKKEKGRPQPQVRILDSVEELSTRLADFVAELSESFVKERGSFSIVLSGGGDLMMLLGKLSGAPYSKMVDWSKWHVFWAEEKVLPKNHPESNYKLAKEAFLSKVPISPGHVTRVGPGSSGKSAAEEYEYKIRQLVRNRTVDVSRWSDCPRFDLVLLALGAEGRLLVSGEDSINNGDEEGSGQCVPWVLATGGKEKEREGVRMTISVINSAANVAVVATGSAVAPALASALSSASLQPVSPANGNLVWLVDTAAASLLSGPGLSAAAAAAASSSVF